MHWMVVLTTIVLVALVFCLFIPSFRLRDNSVRFQECAPFWVGILCNMNIVKMFEIVFSFNVKDNNIFLCLHNIEHREMLQCFINQNAHVYIKQ